MQDRLMYVELKTGYRDNGPAWIGRARFSKSGRTVYFNGLALARLGGQGISGNHFDIKTREEYWISGVKKDGRDRHSCGGGKVMIDRNVVDEYLQLIDSDTLDMSRFELRDDFVETNAAELHRLENLPLQNSNDHDD
jgi:hypothetical protein